MRDFKNLNIFQENQINAILDANKEKSTRLKSIRDTLSDYYIDEITEMNDYQIAKIRRRNGKEWYYATFLNYKSLHEFAMTFDQAVLICLSYKYDNNRSDAAGYIARLLNVNFYPEEIE